MNEKLLEGIIRREACSFLQYVREAFPWSTAAKEGEVAQVLHFAAQEQEAVARIARWLSRRHHPLPPTPPFPMEFTNCNFVSIDFLLPRLLESQRHGVALLEADLARLTDPAAQELVQQLLNVKREHLDALQAMTAAVPAGAGH